MDQATNQIILQLISEGIKFFFGAITGFLAAWLAFKYGSERDIRKVTADLESSLKASTAQKKRESVEDVWRKMRVAMEKASNLTAIYKQYPDFNNISEDATREIIENSRLRDSEKNLFYSSKDRNKFYIDQTFWHDLSDANKALYELNVNFQDNKIFLTDELCTSISELIKSLNSTLISHEIWKQTDDRDLAKKGREEMTTANGHAEEVEKLAREELEVILTH